MTEYRKSRASRDVRYGAQNDEVLRSVLHSVYRSRCYWCSKVKDFTDIEIDHIIPKSLSGAALTQALERHGLSRDFNRNEVVNLAPICGRCNSPLRKGGQDFTALPVVASALRRAHELGPQVERRVREFGRRQDLAKAFLAFNATDLEDPRTRRYVRENMPTLLRKLAVAGDDLVAFPLYRVAEVEVAAGEFLEVPIELTASSRKAAELLETIGGVPINHLLQAPIVDLWQQIHRRAHDALENSADHEEDWGPTYAGPPTAEYLLVDVTEADLTRARSHIEVSFEGNFSGRLTSSLVRDNPYDWESSVRELQGDAVVEGTFSIGVTLDVNSLRATPYAEEAIIDAWTQDVWTTETG